VDEKEDSANKGGLRCCTGFVRCNVAMELLLIDYMFNVRKRHFLGYEDRLSYQYYNTLPEPFLDMIQESNSLP
jgi:hypothetical protein